MKTAFGNFFDSFYLWSLSNDFQPIPPLWIPIYINSDGRKVFICRAFCRTGEIHKRLSARLFRVQLYSSLQTGEQNLKSISKKIKHTLFNSLDVNIHVKHKHKHKHKHTCKHKSWILILREADSGQLEWHLPAVVLQNDANTLYIYFWGHTNTLYI